MKFAPDGKTLAVLGLPVRRPCPGDAEVFSACRSSEARHGRQRMPIPEGQLGFWSYFSEVKSFKIKNKKK